MHTTQQSSIFAVNGIWDRERGEGVLSANSVLRIVVAVELLLQKRTGFVP